MNRILIIASAVATIALAGSALADPQHSHGTRDHHSSADDSYWGRHVDAYRDHRYGDPTIHHLKLKPAYRSRDDRDDDDQYEGDSDCRPRDGCDPD